MSKKSKSKSNAEIPEFRPTAPMMTDDEKYLLAHQQEAKHPSPPAPSHNGPDPKPEPDLRDFDGRLMSVAARHVATPHLAEAARAFAHHVNEHRHELTSTTDPEQFADDFFKQHVERMPFHAFGPKKGDESAPKKPGPHDWVGPKRPQLANAKRKAWGI